LISSKALVANSLGDLCTSVAISPAQCSSITADPRLGRFSGGPPLRNQPLMVLG
jgi:hypothetical protein